MLLSRIKITAAALLVSTFAGAGLWQARTRADGASPPGGNFRVTVNTLIDDESTVVTQVGIEMPPGCTVEVLSDKSKRGEITLRTDGPSPTQLIVLGDQVQWEGSPTNAVKFLLGYKIGSTSGSISDAGPMPADARQLADLLTVPIKSGEYKFGQATKLATYKGVTYSLVVSRSK
jgi:hypothetical protein